MIILKEQTASQIVDIGQWPKHEELAVYPEGARIKNLLAWPILQPNYIFGIPGHSYLFKLSRTAKSGRQFVYPEEYWMEIFAYQLGCLVGVSVPPAFVAYNSATKEPGALIEWFYDFNGEKYESGGDILQARIKEFDRVKGRKHNFQSIVQFLFNDALDLENTQMEDFAKIIAFDALIGNSDRHQDNWGIVYRRNKNGGYSEKIAPAFDNGASMGREIREEAFDELIKAENLKKYVKNGKPHMKWMLEQDYKTRDNHEGLLKRIIQQYPQLKQTILSCFEFSQAQISGILEGLVKFQIDYPLTEKRANFMLHLINYRRNYLLSILNETY